MAGINKVILVGHLGKDPEVRSLESGVKVATFSMATTESYKDKNGERRDETQWHNIVCWRNLAEIAEKWVKKGQLLYLEGKLTTRSYDDKDGIKRYVTEIVANNFTMLGKNDAAPRVENAQGGQPTPNVSENDIPAVEDGDLPF